MWQRFTERARKVVFYAQEEALKYGAQYVGPEHLLLGLIREDGTVAIRALASQNILAPAIHKALVLAIGEPKPIESDDMTLTPRAKRVIDLAYDEARNLNNNYIGTEHLLLGLIREGDGVAARVLQKLGADLEEMREIVRNIQEQERPNEPGAPQARQYSSYLPHAGSKGLLSILVGNSLAEHLLACLLTDKESAVGKVIVDQCPEREGLRSGLYGLIQAQSLVGLHANPTESIGDLLRLAQQESGEEDLQPIHFLLALLRPDRRDPVSKLLGEAGITYEKTRELAAKGEA